MRYDVAISFAGENRSIAAELAERLAAHGHSVFYDVWEQADLLGKDLFQHLSAIYRDDARYCVIIISQHYTGKIWTRHELKSAQARAFASEADYILPLRLDDSPVKGLLETTGFLDLRKISIVEAAALLSQKLSHQSRSPALTDKIDSELTTADLIKTMTEDTVAKTRADAAWCLDLRRDPRAIGSLLVALSDSDWTVRSNAGWALVHLGNVVRPHVAEIGHNSPNPDAREMAQLVLERLQGDWLERL